MVPHKNAEPLVESVADTLRDFYLRAHRALDRAMSAQGASFARAKMLTLIGREPSVRSTDIANWFGFAPRTVTEAIDNLEREGFVVRNSDPHDRRVKRISLTAAGERAVGAAEAVRHDHLSAVFGVLDAAECEQIIRLIGKLNARLGELDG